ncbi:MAG: TetR/AcrR family transcriptional regulator [Dysgonomonas sp.]|jgi:AcrR family transcriptional regulator|nr:TetR/AcrR family transcriptional regulator [Prevotella sp.]MDR3057730.1 TetR/AcrR family transcriptional regulator [Prevotella sp.]
MEKDISTEEKIKEAARKVFQEKGYGQARTRDIADAAGINLALLNYYFRSKEKLFDIIMEESLTEIFFVITSVVNDEETSLSEKIEAIVSRYTDSLLPNPNLPLFVLSEIQANPQRLLQKVGVPLNMMTDSHFYKQIEEQVDKVGIKISPFHFFINIVSMSIFPVVGKPLLMNLHTSMNEKTYLEFIEERRKLIPQWIKMMLKLDN